MTHEDKINTITTALSNSDNVIKIMRSAMIDSLLSLTEEQLDELLILLNAGI